MNTHVEVIIIGAGGAGLFCAATAAKRGRTVLVIDHNAKPGRKILISGGGRCNFTNLGAGPEHFHSRNPHFCRSALARYTPADFVALVERHRIPYHEKQQGQLFCDGPASAILDLLLEECRTSGATLSLGTSIASVERLGHQGFRLTTNRGTYTCDRLVIATGGLSIPTIGATDFGHRLARHFGLKVVATAPALVPLTMPAYADLSGLSVNVQVTCNGRSFTDAMLFTHHGLSGPAILQISTWWNPGDPVEINLLPELDLAAILLDAKQRGIKQILPNLLADLLPRRLVERWVRDQDIPESLHHLTDSERKRLAATFHNWQVRPIASEGYRKAEVTRGGIDTDELSSKTMEAKHIAGLYCIGEVVDVTGWLGGYNFQWAWASAHAAASAM